MNQDIDDSSRREYLEGLNEDYAALRQDANAWAQLQDENEMWDVTNLDGLEDG